MLCFLGPLQRNSMHISPYVFTIHIGVHYDRESPSAYIGSERQRSFSMHLLAFVIGRLTWPANEESEGSVSKAISNDSIAAWGAVGIGQGQCA